MTTSAAPTPDWLSTWPAPRLVADGLVLRAWRRDDGPDLLTAVLESATGLAPWLAWAADYGPESAEAFIEHAIATRAAGSEFHYAIVDPDGAIVGGGSLLARLDPGGLEIGYWVHRARTGRGVATLAAARLTAAAFDLPEVTHVEIHHDRANEPSGRIPERLGFARISEAPRQPEAPGECGVEVQWRLDRDGYPTSRAHRLTRA